MKKKTIKLEGQDFELGFMLAHKDAASFLAQCVKQKLFADGGEATQSKMLTKLYEDAVAQQALNDAAPEPTPAPAATTTATKYDGMKKGPLQAELRKRTIEFPKDADEAALIDLLVQDDNKAKPE